MSILKKKLRKTNIGFKKMKNINVIIAEAVAKVLKETDCGGVMQDGGTNPSAGQYDVPFGDVQRKDIYAPVRKRSKDFKNGSMAMQKAEDEKDVNKKNLNESIDTNVYKLIKGIYSMALKIYDNTTDDAAKMAADSIMDDAVQLKKMLNNV